MFGPGPNMIGPGPNNYLENAKGDIPNSFRNRKYMTDTCLESDNRPLEGDPISQAKIRFGTLVFENNV